jgi:hypothetical protein
LLHLPAEFPYGYPDHTSVVVQIGSVQAAGRMHWHFSGLQTLPPEIPHQNYKKISAGFFYCPTLMPND